jgi:hypothetical protein
MKNRPPNLSKRIAGLVAADVLPMVCYVLLSPCLFGATYYVSTGGNDNNAGTQVAPFATIQQGVNFAQPGDTVLVADGTYGPDGQYTCGTVCSQAEYAAPVTFTRSGTASAPITIAAQNKWKAVLDCQLPTGYAGDGTDGIQVCDAYFKFSGRASYITIYGFDIQRAYWVGAMVNSQNTNIAFIGNHFHHIGNRIYTVPSGAEGYGIVGVYAGTGSSYIMWDQNQFDNIGRLPHPGTLDEDDYNHDHGLYIYNGPYTITNNVFFGQAAGWNIQTAPGAHDLAIVNNTLIGGANPMQDGCMVLWGLNTNVTIENNIFFDGTNYAMDNFETVQVDTLLSHNIVFGSGSGLLAPVSGNVVAVGNYLNADPLFVDAAANDYHLRVRSPAIDAGAAVDVTVDFDGNPRPFGAAIDIGAFEFVGQIRHPATPRYQRPL